MKKSLFVLILIASLLLCACGNTDFLNRKTFVCEVTDGFLFAEWAFKDGTVNQLDSLTHTTKRGTYTINGYEVTITWEPDAEGEVLSDWLTYAPETDTMTLDGFGLTFTRKGKG